MNVQTGRTVGEIARRGEIIQLIPYPKAECRQQGRPSPGMTKCTTVETLLTRKDPCIHNILTRLFAGMFLVIRDVFRTRPVTSFAADAIDDLLFIEKISAIGIVVKAGFCIGGMTLETGSGNRPVIAGGAVGITRTVAPIVQSGRIRQGQLE